MIREVIAGLKATKEGMMIVGEKYKLESDSLNITLLERKVNKKTGKEYWINIAYLSSPKNAMKYLADYELMGDGFKDLESITKRQDEIYSLINSLNIPKKL